MPLYVSYCRVSTSRQGISGLGLEAQQQAVEGYVQQVTGDIVARYVEVESGASKRRPQLEAALAECRKRKAILLIAKLDRLARNVAFISALMEAGVDFVAADLPYANKLILHIMSAFAEFEREQISARTVAALAAAKRRGVRLGTYGQVLARVNRAESLKHAGRVSPSIEVARSEGCVTLQSIADYLNKSGVETAKGGRWHATSVRRILERLSA